jgi:tetratricopeptide (TPR) repeat protein
MPGSRIEAAFAALGAGDTSTALAIGNEILTQNPDEPNALQVLGVIAWEEGRTTDARSFFERANKAAPNHPPVLNSLGVIYRELGDLQLSRLALERAVRAQQGFAEAWHNLGTTLAAIGEDARPAFEKAVALNPRSGVAVAKLAHYLEARHEVALAREYAELALTLERESFLALSTLINLELRAGNNLGAISLADRALSSSEITPTNRAIIHSKRATALEKLSRFRESFADSAKANFIMRSTRGKFMEQAIGPRSPATLARLESFARFAPASIWTKAKTDAADSPVFLVGFPRSGTTMLDQILSTIGSVSVMEEKENIADAWMEILMEPEGLARWQGMGPTDAARLVSAYWRRAKQHVRDDAKIVIDKLPLDTALLGIIHFLFPKAKIIFALRDPRDVVLSCFQQMFNLNAAMCQFLDLKLASEYYDQVMRIGMLWRERLPLDIVEVRYEKIVADFDSEVGALLELLGLPWSDGLRRFHETALQRTIRTPSAKQVVQPLYNSAVGKWRNYEDQLSPVRPILDPWAQRFGYQV